MCEVLENKLRQNKSSNPCNITLKQWHRNYIWKYPKNVETMDIVPWRFLWMSTEYFLCETNVHLMPVLSSCVSNAVSCRNYPAKFNVHIIKSHRTVISLSINRIFAHPSTKPEEGYFLRLYLEICYSHHPGLFTDIPCNINSVALLLKPNDFPKNLHPINQTAIKCGFWMYETEYLENEVSTRQSEMLTASLREAEPTPQALADLAFLMDREDLHRMFSGRQNNDFAEQKIILLKRSLMFASELARRKNCYRDNIPYDNPTPISLMLGYINSGVMHEIDARQCIELYRKAVTYSMLFLKKEATFLLSENLQECNDVVDAFVMGHMADDWMLMEVSLGHFLRLRRFIDRCNRWEELTSQQVDIIEYLADKKRYFQNRREPKEKNE